MSVEPIRRNLVVQRWGTPQTTSGSLNEPREREEHGVEFNEKWVYRLPRVEPDDPRERIVYWRRYDFVASFVVGADGRVTREDPAVLLAGLRSRGYLPSGVGAVRTTD
ncbi:MAG TPA: hypothetical protein VGK30_02710 [Candidatus Binatia bacterium]